MIHFLKRNIYNTSKVRKILVKLDNVPAETIKQRTAYSILLAIVYYVGK